MKIVILDGYTTNPGDISWEQIKKIGETHIYDRTSKEEVIHRAIDAEVLLVNDIPITKTLMEQLPRLKYIGVLATGYNIVDIKAAKELGICVTNVPEYSTASVAQSTLALILELCHRTGAHSDAVHRGDWSKSDDYCFWNYPLIELSGKTLGIIGYGKIGSTVGRIASAFGMKIIATSSRKNPPSENKEVEFMPVNEVLERADFVSIHCPLTEDTEEMINKDSLKMMKPGSFLINVSRGAIVVEKDVVEALNSGHLAGVGLDVLSTEPPKVDNPLIGVPNCIITPHIAWAPIEARKRLVKAAAENLEAFVSGTPIHVVSG